MRYAIVIVFSVMICVLFAASRSHAGPNSKAIIAVSLNRDSGFVKGDAIRLTVAIKGGVSVTSYLAEVLYDSAAVFFSFASTKLAETDNASYQSRPITGIGGFSYRAEAASYVFSGHPSFSGNSDLVTFVFTSRLDFVTTRFGIRMLTLDSSSQSDEVYPSPNPLLISINGSGSISREFIPTIPGDLNLDGMVDFNDFFIFAQNFGKKGSKPTDPKTVAIQAGYIIK